MLVLGRQELLLCIAPIRLCTADVSRLARLASLGSLGGPNAAERSKASETVSGWARSDTRLKAFSTPL